MIKKIAFHQKNGRMRVMIKRLMPLFLLCAVLIPLGASAAFDIGTITKPDGDKALDLKKFLSDLINNIISPIMVAIVIILFGLAGMSLLTAQGNPEKTKQAINYVIWGLLGIIVMILGFFIVNSVKQTLFPPPAPQCVKDADCNVLELCKNGKCINPLPINLNP